MPDVVGRGEGDARSTLDRAGWKATTRIVDSRADKGTVVGQSPNSTALPGETILLEISSGQVPPPPPPPGGSTDTTGGPGGNRPRQPW